MSAAFRLVILQLLDAHSEEKGSPQCGTETDGPVIQTGRGPPFSMVIIVVVVVDLTRIRYSQGLV